MPASELKSEDVWQKSLLLLDIGQQHAALEELRALVVLEPHLAKAHFLLGRLLLESGDESGLQNLTIAAQQSEEFLEPAGHLGYGYLMERGRKGEAVRFWDKCRAA
jgi:tetratricopeptide (TPR) repeat protein